VIKYYIESGACINCDFWVLGKNTCLIKIDSNKVGYHYSYDVPRGRWLKGVKYRGTLDVITQKKAMELIKKNKLIYKLTR
jgi:hypothetical protein